MLMFADSDQARELEREKALCYKVGAGAEVRVQARVRGEGGVSASAGVRVKARGEGGVSPLLLSRSGQTRGCPRFWFVGTGPELATLPI